MKAKRNSCCRHLFYVWRDGDIKMIMARGGGMKLRNKAGATREIIPKQRGNKGWARVIISIAPQRRMACISSTE